MNWKAVAKTPLFVQTRTPYRRVEWMLVIITEIDFQDQAFPCSSSSFPSLQFLYGDFCNRTNKSQSASSSACPTSSVSFSLFVSSKYNYGLVHRYPSKVILLKGFWLHAEPPLLFSVMEAELRCNFFKGSASSPLPYPPLPASPLGTDPLNAMPQTSRFLS